MKIAIDCRYLGKSGIGRVLEGILDHLDYAAHTFYLVGDRSKLLAYRDAVVVDDPTDPFSVRGMVAFSKKTVNYQCDALIIPNFIIPLGISVPVFTVMHDLIFLDVKQSVNGKIDYAIKKYLLKRCMKKSQSVACVSSFTESRCERHFGKYAGKCYVNHNGVSEKVLAYASAHAPSEKENCVVYVGNVKRHKGLGTLLEAFSLSEDGGTTLKIIGERDGFITGLDLDGSAYKNVVFTGRLDDERLYGEIAKAKFLIQPSVYEGFGLPPLEALVLGTQPVISDIEVFKEIYSSLPVVFFKCGDARDLADKMAGEPQKIDCAEAVAARYSFAKFTKELVDRIINYEKNDGSKKRR